MNQKFEFEDPQVMASILGHEGLHHDAPDSNMDELVANVLEALAYGQFVSEDPGIARQGTELVRRKKTLPMELLNTRTPEGRVNLTNGQGQIFPGGSLTETIFAEIFTSPNPSDNVDAPGNPALLSAIGKVTGQPVASAEFDQATIDLLDRNINTFRPKQWTKIARTLKLDLDLCSGLPVASPFPCGYRIGRRSPPLEHLHERCNDLSLGDKPRGHPFDSDQP